MSLRMCVWLVMLGVALSVQAEEIVFKKRGQLVKKIEASNIPGDLKVKAETVTVWEPHEDRNKPYKAFPFNSLLKAVYGNDWVKTEEILFTCVDGYQASVPIERFKKHLSYLSFGVEGGEFKVNNRFQNEKEVPLGPFYLIWENIKDQVIRREGGRDWPYQVASVDLILFKERYPTIAPQAEANAQVKRGFLVYRECCMTCHKINGEGGERGPELNYPVSVTEYIKENWLERWIKDPASIRANTVMPAQPELNKQDVKDLIAYLKAMAKIKKAPVAKEEPAK